MSEVLFGQSYFLQFDPKLWEAMQPYPPLGTMYAASFMRSRGYSVALFDSMLSESEKEWEAALRSEQPRYAVLFEDNFNYLSKMCLLRMRQAAFTMIGMARQAGCTIIVCGSDASDHAEEYIHEGAHFILIGEGESTLGELLDALSKKVPTPFESIAGLVYPEQNQDSENASVRVVRTPRRPDLHDLDALPFPAWDLIDVPHYREIWMRRHGFFSMNMVTTRGCPFHCNWCAKPIWGQRYNTRSPENVIAEMKWLQVIYHPDHIWFADDILGVKPGWLENFAELIQHEGIHIPFKSLNRVDLLLRGKTISSLAQAGADIVWVGAESGSQKILDAMEKGSRVEQIYTAARLLHAAGVRVGFFLQFGYPGEEMEDIQKTIQMVRDCQPDDIGISVSYPLPGTKFYTRVHEQMGEKQNWIDSQDLAMMYHGTYSTDFYHKLYSVIHKEFRMRKTWHELHRPVRSKSSSGIQRVQRAGKMLYQWASLPVARWQLNQLARRSHTDIHLRTAELDPEEAARPTPQVDR